MVMAAAVTPWSAHAPDGGGAALAGPQGLASVPKRARRAGGGRAGPDVAARRPRELLRPLPQAAAARATTDDGGEPSRAAETAAWFRN